MPTLDTAAILIGNTWLEKFISYRVESSLFKAADAFQFELARTDLDIGEGQQCWLDINGQLELVGIIDKITESLSMGQDSLVVEGRDMMGLLVDSYVMSGFDTLEGYTLKQLTEELLIGVPYIHTNDIIYGRGGKLELKTEGESSGVFANTQDQVQIEPGQSKFDVLKEYAGSMGLLFFYLPDGRFVFGEPVSYGQAAYNLVYRKNGQGTNVIGRTRVRDISQRHSKVKIGGQQQGSNLLSGGDVNVSCELEDDTYPNPELDKPYFEEVDTVQESPLEQAKAIINRQRFEGLQLEYKVPGHSQGTPGHSQGRHNYQVNAIAHVIDEGLRPPIRGKNYLIYARTFEMTKGGGVTTTLRLSELGARP